MLSIKHDTVSGWEVVAFEENNDEILDLDKKQNQTTAETIRN